MRLNLQNLASCFHHLQWGSCLLLALILTFAGSARSDELGLDPDLFNFQQKSVSNAADSANSNPADSTQPFILSLTQKDSLIQADFVIAPGAYIYKDSIRLEADGAVFSLPALPPAQKHQDMQGTHEVYFEQLQLQFEVQQVSAGSTLKLYYQGCDSAGICYPPATATLKLEPKSQQGADGAASTATGSAALQGAEATVAPDSASVSTAAADSEGVDQKIARLLAENLWLGLILCIGFGVLLDLTPCVLPMLPVFSAMVSGGAHCSKGQIIKQNLGYSAGLCATYTLLGLLFAYAGASLQGLLQHPAVTLIIAALLVLCALACVDLIKVKLPDRLSLSLQEAAGKRKDGTIGKAFILGIVSALIASPCTSAPLAGALLYVLSSGNLTVGAAAFCAIGLGMALPLFIIGICGANLFKKAGRYSNMIKKVFAALLVIAALYLCRNLIAYEYYVYALSTLLFAAIIYIGYEFILDQEGSVQFFPAALLFAAAFFLSDAAEQALLPATQTETASGQQSASAFTQINRLQDLEQYRGQKVLLDFTASWCSNCKIMEQGLFASAEFKQITQGYTLLQFDISDTTAAPVKEMIEKFRLFGVPYLVVLDENVQLQAQAAGLQGPEDIKRLLGD